MTPPSGTQLVFNQLNLKENRMETICLHVYFATTVPAIEEKVATTQLIPGSGHLVTVTHINDPHSFYVRISSLRHAVFLLEKPGPAVTFANLKPGMMVVYMSKTRDKYVRGNICKIYFGAGGREIQCSIFAIDYGNFDNNVNLKDIFLPDAVSAQIKGLALHCQLHSCEPLGREFDEEAIHAMKYFVGKYTAKIIIHSINTPEKYNVKLKCVDYYYDIAKLLATQEFTRAHGTLGKEPVFVRNPLRFKPKKLNAGDILRVMVLSGYTVYGFHVIEVNEITNYYNFAEWLRFNNYCRVQPPLDSLEAALDGRACGVKMSNPTRYERGYVKMLSVPKTKAFVQLVDWGQVIEAHIKNIKPVKEEFTRPPMALFCCSERNRNVNYGLGGQLLFPGIQLGMEVLEPGNGFRIAHKVKLHPLSIFNDPEY